MLLATAKLSQMVKVVANPLMQGSSLAAAPLFSPFSIAKPLARYYLLNGLKGLCTLKLNSPPDP
jgi:hypothetical protein